jgi:hypothetical protein
MFPMRRCPNISPRLSGDKMPQYAAHPGKAPQSHRRVQTIALRPVDGAHWMIEVSGVQNAQLFMNGGLAEAAALHFAETLADAGQNARLRVYLPDGTLGGQFVAVPA